MDHELNHLNLNHLTLERQIQHIWAKHQDVNIRVVYWVTRVVCVGVIDIMKQEFSQASLSLIVGLQLKFPIEQFMNA
jgi:hypothetical protein